jgi:hypothetical protein
VVDSHYASTKAKAKKAKAKAKVKQASAKRKASSAAKDAAEAKAAQDEAERLEREAQALEIEAQKLADFGVDQELLLSFPSTRAMTEFAAGVKRNNIPKAKHQALADHLKTSDVAARAWAQEINAWWFKASGKAEKLRRQGDKERKQWKFREKTLDEFTRETLTDVKELIKALDAIKPFADQIENTTLVSTLDAQLAAVISVAQAVREGLPRPENVVPMDLKKLEVK